MDIKSREIIRDYKQCLLEAVSFPRIQHLLYKYQVFTKIMLDDIKKGDADFYVELCTRGPTAFSNFIKILKEAEYYELAELLQRKRNEEQLPRIYKMDSDPSGYCLIIINEEFDSSPLRKGCDADAKALEDLFHNVLNFQVESLWNKSAKEMRRILEEFSKKTEFRNVDCCIVYILSHGNQKENLDFIYGTDGEIILKNDIYNLFNSDNCKSLIGKPKLFFFQACRGPLLDGIRRNISSGSDVNDNENSEDATDVSYQSYPPTTTMTPTSTILTDMFIVHPTLLNYKAWKNDCLGSWLAQDLVSVIPEYLDRYDFATMMTMVCAKQMNRESKEGFKQVMHFEQKGVTGILKFKRK